MISPVTHSNYMGAGVQPDVQTNSSDMLVTAYALSLKTANSGSSSRELKTEKEEALKDPKAALLQENEGCSQD
jgi:hypothetical protein